MSREFYKQIKSPTYLPDQMYSILEMLSSIQPNLSTYLNMNFVIPNLLTTPITSLDNTRRWSYEIEDKDYFFPIHAPHILVTSNCNIFRVAG